MAARSTGPLNLFAVDGLVAVISGGGSGLGLMMTKALEGAGAEKIFILGRRENVLQDVAKGSSKIIPVVCDVSSKSQVLKAVDTIKAQCGHIDLLVINSGVLGPKDTDARKVAEAPAAPDSISKIREVLLSHDEEDYATTYAINVTAIVYMAAAFLELLDEGNKKKGFGKSDDPAVASSQIITVTSIASFNRAISAGLAYSSSKAAATHLGKMLSTLLAPFHIRSNLIAPGRYPSGMNPGAENEKNIPHDQIPEGRAGSVDDMAGTILYMASRAGAYLNGTVIVTDGGRLSVHPATY